MKAKTGVACATTIVLIVMAAGSGGTSVPVTGPAAVAVIEAPAIAPAVAPAVASTVGRVGIGAGILSVAGARLRMGRKT